MRKVSLERYYFVLYDCALTSKISKMALKSFCDKTLQIISQTTLLLLPTLGVNVSQALHQGHCSHLDIILLYNISKFPTST